MKSLANKHRGQTCVIIGNGPSLRKTPRELLRKYPTFGTNRIYLLDFTPTYYVAVNSLVIKQFSDEINVMRCPKFILSLYAHLIIGSYPLKRIHDPLFSTDITQGVYEGHTVTYTALQIAYYMGFTTALLVGVDHRYIQDGTPNSEQVAKGQDVNHFHPDYFSNGAIWHLADLEKSTQAYKLAQTAYAKAGRRIFNLTPGSALNVFRKSEVKLWMD